MRVFKELELNKQIIELSKELEDARMQLVACSVVAGANTRESTANVRPMHPDYMCPAVKDVIRAVDREIDLREQLADANRRIEYLELCDSEASQQLSRAQSNCDNKDVQIEDMKRQLAAKDCVLREIAKEWAGYEC